MIQSAKRFNSNNGILSLDKAELDLYSDMCLRSQHLSHEAIFEPDLRNVSSKLQQPHKDDSLSLRAFGQQIFADENIVEVNKFTRRTHKQEFVSENAANMRGALKNELMKMNKQGSDTVELFSNTASNSQPRHFEEKDFNC